MPTIRIGNNLTFRDGTYWLHLDSEETKNCLLIDVSLPRDMTAAMTKYLEQMLSLLMCGRDLSHLWVTLYGKPVRPKALGDRIRIWTEAYLGVPVGPKGFRHCDANSIAKFLPHDLEAATNLLAHRNLQTVARHYNHTGSLKVGQLHQAPITKLHD